MMFMCVVVEVTFVVRRFCYGAVVLVLLRCYDVVVWLYEERFWL